MAQKQDTTDNERTERASDFNISLKTLIHLGYNVLIWAFILLLPYLTVNRLFGAKFLGMTASLISALMLVFFQTLFRILNSEMEETGLGKWIEVLISGVTLVSALIIGFSIDSVFGSNFLSIGPYMLFAAFSAIMFVITIVIIISRRTAPLVPFIQSSDAPRSTTLLAVLAIIIFLMNIGFIGCIWILESLGISSTILTPLFTAACFVLVTAPSAFAFIMIRYDWSVAT